jgi:hypothetical protein
LFPAFDSGEDALWIGGPFEGFGIGVCLGDEEVDGELQVNDGPEHASFEATARELGEEAFDRIEPGCRGRGEVERPAGMPGQPLAYLRMLVGRIVVDDGVDNLFFSMQFCRTTVPGCIACKILWPIVHKCLQ